MSTDAVKDTACPSASEKSAKEEASGARCEDACDDEICEKKRQKPSRKVSFPPNEDQLVTQYFEPANPWQDVPPTSREQLASEYVESCRRHNTQPIHSVLFQIQELPESAIGGSTRAPRLTLDNCSLLTSAPADALEAVLKKTQFRRITIDHAEIGDEGAEALFDMIEYYESASTLTINGPRQFGIRGWQAASRMIRKSAELTELEVTSGPIEAGHAPVLARALRPHTCALRSLSLQHTALCGEPLACLVIALRSNSSVRELRLGDNGLSPSDALQLACLLRANTRLKLLDLSNNNIQDSGVSHIADALVDQAGQTPPSAATSPLSPHQCPVGGYESRGLAFLVLWNNQLTRNCANHIAKAMRSSQSLCVLNIGRNALGTETIRAFKSPGALISLGLQAARLGPDAGRALADLVRARTKLQRLDLRDNKLGNTGLQAILNALKDNNTLIQIDLDDASESSSTLSAENGGEEASCGRLAKEISTLCRRNESASAGEHRVHRKISLTCHTAKCLLRGGQSPEEERRARRLRSPAPSPAPSPAGSPVPGAMPTRFSVTRVTPERDPATPSSDSCSPTTPTRASPSRFRVIQVSEPPQIQVQAADSTPRRSASRFSVTRNTDTMYKLPQKVDKAENPSGNKPSDVCSDKTVKSDSGVTNKSNFTAPDCGNSDVLIEVDAVSDATVSTDNKSDVKSEVQSEKTATAASATKYLDKSEKISHDETVSDKGDEKMIVQETKLVKNSREVSDKEKVDVKVEVTVKKECVADNSNSQKDSFKHVNIVNSQAPAKVHNDQIKPVIVVVDDKRVVEVNKNDTVSACIEKGNKLTSKDVAIKQIEAITHDFENLIHEMQTYSEKSGVLARKSSEFAETKVKNDSTQTDIPGVINITVEKEKDIISKDDNSVPVTLIRDSLVLKKNKSESSLDSPDLEVSRLMNKKPLSSPFFDSSSSLEISGSSMESLNASDNNQNTTKINKPMVIQETVEVELDRRKPNNIVLTTEGSIESTASENTPVNSGNFLNTSLSSNESVSPIIFGKNKKIHGSLSSLEASVSSIDSARGTERTMVTSADSGIENSLQNPSESKEDSSSNEGTLTNSSSLRDSVKIPDRPEYLQSAQDTLTSSPKRTSSLLDVPALKSKGLDRMRKISWVAPSASFHIPKPEEPPKVESKLPTHLEKLLSLFHNPGSLFSRSNEEEKRAATNTPPRKESTSLTTSFWSWGTGVVEKEEILEDRDSSPEITDSTLSERVQISYVDESFSKKLDSKTPSTDTDNTLSEFQSFPIQGNSETSDATDLKIEGTVAKVTANVTTDDNLVQKCLDLSLRDTELSSNGNNKPGAVCDKTDLKEPNDFNKNVYDKEIEITSDASQDIASLPEHTVTKIDKIEADKAESNVDFKVEETKSFEARPRSFAAVLKSSGSENSLDRQTSPDNGQSVDKLPSKVIREIKENISPENTLTSSTTKTLALELSERQIKNQPIINAVWEVTNPVQEKLLPIIDDVKPEIPTDLIIPNPIEYTLTRDIDKLKDVIVGSTLHPKIDACKIECNKIITDDPNTSIDSGVTSLEGALDENTVKLQAKEATSKFEENIVNLELVDLGKDALSYLIYENQDFEVSDAAVPETKTDKGTVLSEELKNAEKKEQLIDLSPELVIDDVMEPEVFNAKEVSASNPSPAIPDRTKIKKSNSLEDLSQRLLRVCMEPHKEEPKSKPKNIVFNVPECSTTPRDIPERRSKLRSRSGSSPKSLPESLNKPSPIHKMESITIKKRKVSSLGKMARDSLLALNRTAEDIADIRREYKLTSVESLRSLESVSEDANSQSGNSADSRCKACFRLSQESLMSLDSINEDCRCDSESDKGETSHSAR